MDERGFGPKSRLPFRKILKRSRAEAGSYIAYISDCGGAGRVG